MEKKLTTNNIKEMAGVNQDTVERWARIGLLKGKLVDKPVSEGGEQYVFEEKEVKRVLAKKFQEYLDLAVFYQTKANTIAKNLNL